MRSTNRGWLRDPANRPWIVLGLVIAIIVTAAAIYLWIIDIQPVIDQLLNQAEAALVR